jgi:NAD(P)-dependent dehydrogenase (short-subunit alcohol dehydrogenase family)
MQRLEEKKVLITGGASGIGQATVIRFLREGATVVAADVAEDGLAGTVELAKAESTADRLTVQRLDVADEADVAAAVAAAIDELGGLDVLVNAAGILRSAHTHECSLDLWNQIITVNLTGTFLVTRAALPTLLETGAGVVVNFSSTSAAFAHPYMAAYAASKGGIQSFTHALALEYSKRGLRATCVAPGAIQSGITETTAQGLPADTDWTLFTKTQPLLAQGFADPHVVAGVVAMLASDDGKWITGTEIRIDGGTHA